MQRKVWIAAVLLVIGSSLSGCVEILDPFDDWDHHSEYHDHGGHDRSYGGEHRHHGD